MISFELIDNLFQVSILGCASIASSLLALRHQKQIYLILALAYACFSMGTLYYVLYLVILGHTPKIFYVAEISWMASWLFYLSFQIVRSETIKPRLNWAAICGALVVAACVLRIRIFGPSYFMSFLLAVIVGVLTYLCVFRLQSRMEGRHVDAVLQACVVLQILVYAVSDFTKDYTHFNLYFAVDIALTVSFVSLLPLYLREERMK